MISIGIPTVNGPHRLERCLSHIFKDDSIKRFNAEVLVVDDGSSPDDLARNKEFCSKFEVRLIELGERRGVPVAWNTLTVHSMYDRVLLLNDDIEVMKHWLDVIIYSLDNNPLIGAIGLNTFEGIRKELPPVSSHNEAKLMFGSYNHPLLSCCGCAFAFRKDDFLKVGGFDERYFCFYEEIDFNLSLLRIGKRPAMLSYPILHHYVGETTTSVLSDPHSILLDSEQKFELKWGISWHNIRNIFNSSTIPSVPYVNEWHSAVAAWG